MDNICAFCRHNDGLVYTSIPVKYKCTIENKFHGGDHVCHIEFVPVVHGRWELYPSSMHRRCSVCKMEYEKPKFNVRANYCPNCGAKMDGGKDNGDSE